MYAAREQLLADISQSKLATPKAIAKQAFLFGKRSQLTSI